MRSAYGAVAQEGRLADFAQAVLPYGRYLVFSAGAALAEDLEATGWSGVCVAPRPPECEVPQDRVHIAAHIGPDAHIVKMLAGFWVRAITPDEVFTQFPGPYDLVAAVGTGRDREIWQSDKVFNHLPKLYVLAEDGHNEGIVQTGRNRGYTPLIVDGFLVMVHT